MGIAKGTGMGIVAEVVLEGRELKCFLWVNPVLIVWTTVVEDSSLVPVAHWN